MCGHTTSSPVEADACFQDLHAQRLQALLELGDSVPIPLGPVTLCVREWFSNSDRGSLKGGYPLFLQRKGCWPRAAPTKVLHSSFSEVPLDVSEDGRRNFESFLLEIAADEENSWEAIEALHMLYMVRFDIRVHISHSLLSLRSCT